jgi:dolichyl-phosphate-mannose-protein mannosyltransferase
MSRILKLFRSPGDRGSGFAIGILGIWLLALSLRFWGLGRFNTLVFDEIYYAKYAVNYLNGTEFFDAHPPLGKYCIAVGIWLSQFFPLDYSITTDVAGQNLNPFSYRWLNALIGSWIPLLISGIAYQISRSRSYALIAGFLATLEGLWLVESRYALINIYMVFFGLIGQWLFLMAFDRRGKWQNGCLILSGMSLGATIAVKWNGLGFLGSLYVLWGLGWIFRGMTSNLYDRARWEGKIDRSFFIKITNIPAFKIILYLGVLPIVTYSLLWIPHLQINAGTTFWKIHEQMLSYHQGLGTGKDVHPYCSPWYSWPILLRPIGYFYEKNGGENDLILPVNSNPENPIVYDVHLLGNPLLFWLSSAVIVIFIFILTEWIFRGISLMFDRARSISLTRQFLQQSSEIWVLLYLVVNYAVNWLPWAKVSRCTFLYLYMGALVFAVLAIAWLIDRWLRSSRELYQVVGVFTILLVVISFCFWLPIYLGLPLSSEDFQVRMWLPSWI